MTLGQSPGELGWERHPGIHKKEVMGEVGDWLGMRRFGIGERSGWFGFQQLDLKSRSGCYKCVRPSVSEKVTRTSRHL